MTGLGRAEKNRFAMDRTELLVGVGVIVAIAAFVIPAYFIWLPNYRLNSAAIDLYASFEMAKQTAIERNTHCAILFYQDIPPQSGKYYDYVVYVDSNKNFVIDDDEEVIKKVVLGKYKGVRFDLSKGNRIGVDFSQNPNASGSPMIAFGLDGLPLDSNGHVTTGRVFLKNSRDKIFEVVVSLAGKVTVQ